MKLVVITEPKWHTWFDSMRIIGYLRSNSTWWVSYGIPYKYLSARLDSRTGSMLFKDSEGLGTFIDIED